LGFDPAFVNGCKFATVDASGKLLHVDVIYPTVSGKERLEESKRILLSYLRNDKIDYIALGNGTASRESEAFIDETLKEAGLSLPVVIVNEAGASVYSASEKGTEEFPELPVEKRSAISLARRLQDPLSELVKIDPMAMGVGQYQHDLDEKKLSNALHGVVEDAVNEVGVYLNSASYSLLQYVSGIGPSLWPRESRIIGMPTAPSRAGKNSITSRSSARRLSSNAQASYGLPMAIRSITPRSTPKAIRSPYPSSKKKA
jgi:uncharacterized protein